MILAGDLGGTNLRLALVDAGGARVREETVASRDYPGLAEAAAAFLARGGTRPTHACFGVAGPVVDGRSRITNLPWEIAEDAIAAALGLRRARLLNDLQATALGLEALAPGEIETLHAGQARAANAVLVAPGTGLGVALLVRTDGRVVPAASEGGHADFAPTDAVQDDLVRWLRAADGRATVEEVIAGPGIHRLFRFLVETGRAGESAAVAARLAGNGDPSAAVVQAALVDCDPAAAAALDLWARCLGQECGNWALRAFALGGIWLGGGVPRKVLPALRAPAFREAVCAKGRFRALLDPVPLRVVLADDTALRGAARAAQADEAAGT